MLYKMLTRICSMRLAQFRLQASHFPISSYPQPRRLVSKEYSTTSDDDRKISSKQQESMAVKKTPKGRLDKDTKEERHRDAEKEPLPRWPNEENPCTGEKGGPVGPEPTRFGDWERKGRVSDF